MTTLSNPWHHLPTTPPYILPEDLAYIRAHKHFPHLRLDTVPDQAIGGIDKAEVVFLALNPGFDEGDVTVNLQLPGFVEANRNNLQDPYGSSFYYFNGGYEETGGYKWWTKKLSPLLKAGVTKAMLRDKMMLIEYFPYHSAKYHHINGVMPSQRFAFDLVREAIRRDKIIIIMRSKKLWEIAVPELASYSRVMTLNSPQNVTVSPKNIGEDNFETVKLAIIGKDYIYG